MRFINSAAVGGAIVAGASLASAQEYCSDRQTIWTTEYVTMSARSSPIPIPQASTPVPVASSPQPVASSSSVGGGSAPPQSPAYTPSYTPPAVPSSPAYTPSPVPSSPAYTPSPVPSSPASPESSAPPSSSSLAPPPSSSPVEVDSVVTLSSTPLPTISSTSSFTSTIYKTTSQVDSNGGTTLITVPETTTICPVTASETPASTPEVTGITQYTTSTLYHTSTSTDANGGVVTVTIPHSTTVCPVTATETSVAGASSSCSCTTTNTVTVDPEPVTVTVTSTSSPAGVNAADVTSPAAGVSTPVAMPSVDSAVAGVSSAPVPAASSPAAMPVVSDAAVGGAPTPVASSPVIVSTAAAESTPAAAASSPAASSAAGLVGGLTDTAGSAASDAVEAIGEAVSGTATYYTYGTDLSQGTCSFSGYTLPSSIFGTALSDSDWASAGNCGACIRVTGPQQNSIVAMIVDQCPGCGDHHLDLFQDAFTELDSLSTGRINVDWEFVPCGITSGISLLNKDGASEYWFSMQVQNSNLPVESLEVSVDGGKTWTNTTRTEYNYFEHESGFGQATVDVRITSKTGVKVEAKGVTVSSLSSHDVGDNFSS
ncbi:hypothetical protein IWX50DRAFT_340648 [Phyllosticta citricarpa]